MRVPGAGKGVSQHGGGGGLGGDGDSGQADDEEQQRQVWCGRVMTWIALLGTVYYEFSSCFYRGT